MYSTVVVAPLSCSGRQQPIYNMVFRLDSQSVALFDPLCINFVLWPGHAKLEVVTKLALPEPELRFSTNGDKSKGVVAGMGDVDIGIQEFNLLLEY